MASKERKMFGWLIMIMMVCGACAAPVMFGLESQVLIVIGLFGAGLGFITAVLGVIRA